MQSEIIRDPPRSAKWSEGYAVMREKKTLRKSCEINGAGGGESEYPGLLKTHKLLIFRDAKNAEHGKIAPNWNVSGT
jgi:hypothetical protein